MNTQRAAFQPFITPAQPVTVEQGAYKKRGQKGLAIGIRDDYETYAVQFTDGKIGFYKEDALIWAEGSEEM